ncbi:MAG: UvrD-helicase domain-containing protein [Bacteroides sp.]|nr:UvrD-helicase domain-containing protein [Bacteroides sp.]
MGELLIYKASAGSGKTFTLAVEYIKLLILNPRAYRRILAVTFTNKATAEMKERILSQLYGIWTGDAGSKPYLEQVCKSIGWKEEQICQAAGAALRSIIHDYSQFRVETIDSFFQSVMRNLARELELSPNLNVELNNDEILSEAVDSMIEKLQPTSPVLAWLLDYINEKIANDKRWNVSDEIKKFGKNIFDEGYIEKGTVLRELLKNPDNIKNYRQKLHALMTSALKEMESFADQFEEELAGHGLTVVNLKNNTKGIAGYFIKLKKGELNNSIRNKTMEKCLVDEKEWGSKTSPHYQQILSLATSSLIPLLERAERAREKNNYIVSSCRLSLQHLNKLQLLTNIDEEVRILNRENNRFLLSDTNTLLHRLIQDDDPSFVFEKIGASIRNVMIDEFQDTSRIQWSNFRMLLMEGLAQGAYSLIVGDVKQSIYRWRNGDWSILNNLNDRIGNFPINAKTLNTNRRSESNIISFNNLFFQEAVDFLNSIHRNLLNEECYPLKKAYQDIVQESPREEKKGYVKISFLDKNEEHDYPEQTLTELGEEIKKLSANGVQLNDIAILVRKNKNILLIADYFDKEMQWRIVSDEAFQMNASVAVNMLMDALRFLSDPSNQVAYAQLMVSYQNEVLRRSYNLNELLLEDTTRFLPKAFIDNISSLRLMPLYELLEELFVIFQMERIEDQDAYLFAFFDAVINYLEDHSSDLESFIEYWEKKLCEKTIPGGEIEGIRIFSIHKSKGLEFHTVLVPFCDWKLENETYNQLIWCAPQEVPYNEIDFVPVNYSGIMAESVYRKDYLQERLQLWVDNLNLLYVAFTRASKNLIVWSHKKQKNTISEVLFNSLSSVAAQQIMIWDEENPYEWGELCPSEKKDSDTNSNKLLQTPLKRPVKMEALHHQVEFRQSNRSSDFIQGIEAEESSSRFIDRGKLLHALFSDIQTVEDVEPALQKLVFEGIIGDTDTEEEIRLILQHAFDDPQAFDWYSGQWQLFNECAILYKDKGVLQIRRPDRVMMKPGEVVIVDLKFGKPQKKYNKQVREYMQLLTRMGYKNIEGFLWYVEQSLIEPVSFR